MMNAVMVRAYGQSAGPAVEAVPIPDPASGEVRIRTAASGVSFLDLLVSEGKYQVKPTMPFTPGSEIAGVVDHLGPGISGVNVGDRVCASAVYGGYAEFVCVPESAVHRIPDQMSLEDASVFLVPYSTAYHALTQRGQLQRGETLFVLGAGGSVGLAAVQVGRLLGATVIAGASTDAKRRAALAAGANFTVDTSLEDWRGSLQAVTAGNRVDVVFDPVGGRFSETAFRCLNWGGRHLVVGFASGTISALPLNLPLVKGASAVGVELRTFNERQPELARQNMARLFEGYLTGSLSTHISWAYGLHSFADAMNSVASNSLTGRAIIRMGGLVHGNVDVVPT